MFITKNKSGSKVIVLLNNDQVLSYSRSTNKKKSTGDSIGFSVNRIDLMSWGNNMF